jgi:hypothetical protein
VRVVGDEIREGVGGRTRQALARRPADDDDVIERREVEAVQAVEPAAVEDEGARAAVAQLMLEEAAAELGVDRGLDHAGPGGAVPGGAGDAIRLEHGRHPVAGPETERSQPAGDP